MRFLAVLLLLASLALAGCSDDGADDGASDLPDDGADGGGDGGDGADGQDDGQDDDGDDDGNGGGTDDGNGTEPEPRDPVTWAVSIVDNDFVDGSLTIQVGDTVVWTHDGVVPHTVTSDEDDGATFDSGNLIAGSEFSYTFDEAGEFPYRCDYHGSMTDTITVLERSDATP